MRALTNTRPRDISVLHPAVRDLWPTAAGPNVLAWSYADDDPTCHTIYTVYKPHPGGRPLLQFGFANGEYMSVTIDQPERFGPYDTPAEFKAWARAWKNAGNNDTHPTEDAA
jgi:hypothetical protein